MIYDYEQSVWGTGEASLKLADPTAPRLRQALLALQKLPAGAKVLEVGCGAGQFIRAVKKMRPDLACHGCDISRSALQQAEQKAGDIRYAVSEPSRFCYHGEEFAAVLIFDVLEHVQDVSGLLSEIQRVLKNGGVFHCFVPCEGDILSLWRYAEKLAIGSGLTKKYAGHIQKFSRRGLKQVISGCGFDLEYSRYSGHFLGQLLDLFVFIAMDRMSRRLGKNQINNEEFFSQINKIKGGWFKVFKKIINLAVNCESWLFGRLPSPNAHLTLIKKT